MDNGKLIKVEGIGAKDYDDQVPDAPDHFRTMHLERNFGRTLLEFKDVKQTQKHSLPKMYIAKDLHASTST